MSKKTSKKYFTKVHEEAIIKYCSVTFKFSNEIKELEDILKETTNPKKQIEIENKIADLQTNSQQEKKKLYQEYIQPAFNELVDKIVYTYKFTSLPNIDELKDECKVWLTTILEKFDPNKGSKAFSYFSVITKNWFIHKVKKHASARRREIEYNELPKQVEEEYLTVQNTYLKDREKSEFWSALWTEINDWSLMPMKPQEKRVYEAVRILLSNPDDIEIFNKKAIYLYLRELTGLNTKQVVNNLNKLRVKYRTFKSDWNNGTFGEVIHEQSTTRTIYTGSHI
jgi:DNA-directed RNA polymerase specialized sigma subunit